MFPAIKVDVEVQTSRVRLQKIIPSWVISLAVHALILMCFLVGFHRTGSPDGNPDVEGSFQIIGTMLTENSGASGGADTDGSEEQDSESAAAAAEAANQTPTVMISRPDPPTEMSNLPRDLLSLPETSSVPASNLPLSTPKTPAMRQPGRQMRLPGSTLASRRRGVGKGVDGGTGSAPGGPTAFGQKDGTSFFSITAQGTHFYYVVDCSGSMEGTAMGLARAEMMASIERLDSVKKFQILFYNAELHPMTDGRTNVFYATEINRTFARQFIANQQPESSTSHMPALQEALAAAPDVIFFLTDGDVPDLKSFELKELVRLNRNNTQIHVVEFGQDAKLGPMNWLERMAKDHGGSYRYRDINALDRE